MTQKQSLFEGLFARRVPQLLGVYIAALWLSVEIADWMSERFGIFEQFSSYVFIGMLTFIPSIVLLSWGHGRPGKDKWSKYELAWLPLNLVLSVYAVNYYINSTNTDIPNTTIQPNATPLVSAPIKPKVLSNNLSKSFNKPELDADSYNSVLSFFWENKTNNTELDWLSYASSWLFTQDLKRTPDISAITPYDSKSLMDEIINRGFATALNVPLALAIQVANKQSKEWIVMGSFAYDEVEKESVKFEAKLYNVKTGSIEKTYSHVDQSQLTSLDEISNAMGDFLLESINVTNIIPDYAIADHTSNNLDAIKTLIEAKNKIAFENDYVNGLILIEKAIELDPDFAEAMLLASKYHRAKGDFESATKYSKQALNFDYKIYKESVYELKANLFDMSGQRNKALLVLENWAEMFPTSPIAQATLANKYLFGDNTLDKAELQFEKLLSIDSSNQNTLISLGQIYRVQGEKEKTLDVLKQYLDSNPDNVKAYMELANAYKQFGMFSEAIEMFEKASILGSDNYAAEIGMASTTAIQGDHVNAIEQLTNLLSDDNTINQTLMINNEKVIIFMQTGQISKAFEALELMKEPAKKILSPLSYIFSMDGTSVQLLILQGKYQEALEYVEIIRENTKPPFNNMATQLSIMTYMSMGDKENFKSELVAFEQFLESFPVPSAKPFISAWNAQATYWNGDVEKSLLQLDAAIEESKQSITGLRNKNIIDEFIYNKAAVMFELGNDDGALEELNQLLNRNPAFAKAHYLSAQIYQSQNDTDNANISIQKAKVIWKDADENFVDLKKLEEL